MAHTPAARLRLHRVTDGAAADATSSRRSTAPGAGSLAHILVPVRLDACERQAVSFALRMAAAHGTRVTVLHVLKPFESPSAHWLDAIDNLHRALDGHPRDTSAAIRKRQSEMREFLEREIPADARQAVDIQVECRVGDVATEIIRAARELAADLVVLRRRPARWRRSLSFGPTHRVVELGTVPIMLA